MSAEGAEPLLRDVVEVADVETVVRLDDGGGRLSDLVLTGDVVRSLSAVLGAAGAESAGRPSGAAFFVVGPFGSGKSHFLSAVGELLSAPKGVKLHAPAGGDLLRLVTAARRSLAVRVPLVEYRASAALEDVVAERAWRSAGAGGPSGGADRQATWQALLDAATAGGHDGVVLLLDELSEFLRAKQGAALTEDLRFLQFLGEWARDRPVVVVAALQESIEEVANVSQRELARIRDRFRPSLPLTMRHVEDLVRGRLVRLQPGADLWVARAWERVVAAFPAGEVTRERFERCYPVHPLALTLLEGLRFVLSQQRGVVDFVSRRLHTALDRPFDALITPDEIFEHFHQRLLERHETIRLADTVVPFYDRAAAGLVDPEDVELTRRTVRLLCLLAASPLERPHTADELSFMLQSRVSEVDPSINVAYLENAVLEPLAGAGAYVVARAAPGGRRTYAVEVEADAAAILEVRLAQARADLRPGDRRVVATVVELGSSETLQLQLVSELGWARRELLWQGTSRSVLVGTERVVELTPEDARERVARARAAGAEGCLLVAELEPLEAPAAAARAEALAGAVEDLAIWVPGPLRDDERASMLDIQARRNVAAAAQAEGRSDLVELLSRAQEADRAVAREILRRAYFAGRVVYPPPKAEGQLSLAPPQGPDLPTLSGLLFERLLAALADPLLAGRHPLHRAVAPHGELVGERLLRQLVADVVAPGRLGPVAAAGGELRSLTDRFLVPMGLARAGRDGITIVPDPGRSPAVAEALRLVGEGEPVATTEVVAALADGPVGLSLPESLLVLNACVRTGLLEAWRGRKRLTEAFLTVGPGDRLGAGELVEPSVRRAVEAMKPICGPGPFDLWTAEVQRRAAEAAVGWLASVRDQTIRVRDGLVRLAESPVFAAAAPGTVAADLETVGEVLGPLSDLAGDTATPVPVALRRMVEIVGDPAPLLGAVRRLAPLAHFFQQDLRRVEEAAAYVTNPELVVPDDAGELQAARERAIGSLAQVLELAAEERLSELFSAEREFRQSYAAAYAEGHDRYHGAVTPQDVEKLTRSPEYQVLARLSAIRAIAVRDDRVKLDRAIKAAVPPPCHQPVDAELAWKPRCRCGYVLGSLQPELDRDRLLSAARRGIAQYVDELAAPETADRLQSAAADLARLGRDQLAEELRALLALLRQRRRKDAPIDELAEVLAGDLPRLLGDVLTGGRLIVTRDLAVLREDLVGRRYPRRKLVELFQAWLDSSGDVTAQAFVEVVDTAEDGGVAVGRAPGAPSDSATVDLLRVRYPQLAAALPTERGADAFWLAAWWSGRPFRPAWLPADLGSEPGQLAAAAEAAAADPEALAELADLDRRIGPHSLLGDEVAAALDVATRPAGDLAQLVATERLLRHPLRLALGALFEHAAADWQKAAQLPDLEAVAEGHPFVSRRDLLAGVYLADAARHLAALERHVAGAGCAYLVEELYPEHAAPVPHLLSRAAVAIVGVDEPLFPDGTLERFRAAAARLLRDVDARFLAHSRDGFDGCLRIWEVGHQVVSPLLEEHGRVAVLLVDAMRADLACLLLPSLLDRLPGRRLERRWAVVPRPTRTAESLAALAAGRPAPAGTAPDPTGSVAFAHLGYETRVLLGADRDHHAGELVDLWTSGPPLSVAVATGVDERLHRTSVELAGLLDEATGALGRRVVPSLASLPAGVPLLVLADHGFRENLAWGHGPEGRYTHGGTSLEECVVPVFVLHPAPGD